MDPGVGNKSNLQTQDTEIFGQNQLQDEDEHIRGVASHFFGPSALPGPKIYLRQVLPEPNLQESLLVIQVLRDIREEVEAHGRFKKEPSDSETGPESDHSSQRKHRDQEPQEAQDSARLPNLRAQSPENPFPGVKGYNQRPWGQKADEDQVVATLPK